MVTRPPLFRGLREFILRGTVIDMAVGIALGGAFVAVLTALGDGFVEPLIRLMFGGSGIDAGSFAVRGVRFDPSKIVNALVLFLLTAAVVYYAVVAPVNRLRNRRASEPAADEPVRECPACVSSVPTRATRCRFCGADLPAAETTR